LNTQHKPTLRVLSVLQLISENQHKYSLSEISRSLDIPASTLLPILHTLRDQKYLEFNEREQDYSFGIRLFEIGSRMQSSTAYSEITAIMSGISEVCNETCHLGVLDQGDILYLAKTDSTQPIRMTSMVGKRIPAYATALGKALLRNASIESLKQLYPQGLKPITAYTLTDFEKLYAQLHADGLFTYESEEACEDVCCTAIPIYRNGIPVAACSVSVPLFRWTAQKRAVVEGALKESVGQFEKIIHYFVF